MPSNEMLPVTVAVKFEKGSVFLVLHRQAAAEQALICYHNALFFPLSVLLQFASIFVFSLFDAIRHLNQRTGFPDPGLLVQV